MMSFSTTLAIAYLAQYQMSKTSQNHKSATSTFERARSQKIGSSLYTTSLIATALWTACELQPQKIDIRAEWYGRFVPAYDLRTKKDRNGLDSSIKCYKESLAMLMYQNPNRAPTLFNLSKQQFGVIR